jgi:hypothetical protein
VAFGATPRSLLPSGSGKFSNSEKWHPHIGWPVYERGCRLDVLDSVSDPFGGCRNSIADFVSGWFVPVVERFDAFSWCASSHLDGDGAVADRVW